MNIPVIMEGNALSPAGPLRHITRKLLGSGPDFRSAGDKPAVEFARKAAVRALNFSQGDVEGLKRARADFTPEEWNEFMKQLRGFIDEKGAPTFNSTFVPSGKAVVVSEQQGVLRIRIPGILTQTHGGSGTTYNHSEIDVKAGGKPLKIEHLEPVYRSR